MGFVLVKKKKKKKKKKLWLVVVVGTIHTTLPITSIVKSWTLFDPIDV
jgi:hypothetical protein